MLTGKEEKWIRNGRKWGDGVYLTDSPSEALGYAGRVQGQGQRLRRRRAGQSQREMMWEDYKVLLALEAAQELKPRVVWEDGVRYFVVRDESILVVRYVFLVPQRVREIRGKRMVREEIEVALGRLGEGRV